MRCPHFSFADLDIGMSSDKHVRHSTLSTSALILGSSAQVAYSLTGFCSFGGGANIFPKKLDRLLVCFVLVMEGS